MMPAAVIGIHSICTAHTASADRAEQQHVDDQHQADALPAEAAVQVALDPVVRRAVAELGQRLLVLRFGAVQLAAVSAARS